MGWAGAGLPLTGLCWREAPVAARFQGVHLGGASRNKSSLGWFAPQAQRGGPLTPWHQEGHTSTSDVEGKLRMSAG